MSESLKPCPCTAVGDSDFSRAIHDGDIWRKEPSSGDFSKDFAKEVEE